MRDDFYNLWLVYRDNMTGEVKSLPALDWIGQPGPIGDDGKELELIGFEVQS